MKKHIIVLMALFLTGITAVAQIDRSTPPASGPDPEIPLVEPYTFELKNGLKVLLVEDHKLPTVSFSLTIDNPPVFEGEKAGVQSLASALVGKGTQKTSKDDFNEEIDFLGASVSVSPNGGFAAGLSRYKERLVELMAEAAFMPLFTQEELDFEKDQLIEGIKSGENSAAAIAGRVRSALVYGTDHPAGEFATEETINNVTLADVEKFYKDHFKPENAYMVISGDITRKEAKKLVKKYFKKWEKGAAPTYNYPEVQDVAQTEINFVNVPNAVQTELAIYNLSELKMNDEDYFAAQIANYIYGGAFGSYLNMNLREANGYTYGARSGLGSGRNYKSTFRATTKVRNEVTDSAVVETLKELKRIRTTEVDEEMLSNAKAKFLGNFIMSSENKRTMANRQITIETNDLPKDFYTNYIANINAVTKEDVQRIANKYMKIDNLRIILVGKASDVLKNVENMEFEGKKFPIKFYDKYANPTERPSTIEIPDGTTATMVINEYIAAIGGKEALEGVTSIVTEMSGSFRGQTMNLTMKQMAPNMMAQEVAMAGMGTVFSQKFDGEKGTMSQMGMSQDMPAEMVEEYKKSSLFKELGMLADPSKMTLKGAEETAQGPAYVIVLEAAGDANTAIYYSMETGLKLQEVTTAKLPSGEEVSQATTYGDYKDVNGIMMPHMMEVPMAGQAIKMNADTIKINEPLTKADFE